MASGFVEHAAIVSGWAAVALDSLLARHLSPYLSAMTPAQRGEMDRCVSAVRAAAGAYDAAGRRFAAETAKRGAAGLLPDSGHVDEVTVQVAAEQLAVSVQWVRRLAARWEPDGLARKVGSTWLVDRVAVAAYKARRRDAA
jgi:hypothetical protein